MVAAAAVSAVGSIYSANQASAQNESQQAWNEYNAQMGYNNSMSNIESQTMLGMFNAAMAQKAGDISADAQLAAAAYNAEMVSITTAYNNDLLAEEDRLLWEAMDLDLVLMERQREAERGAIVNQQASSGTTIGEGSNLDVVADQMKQEAMDAFVIRHNADVGAAQIQNAIAQNTWQGEAQIQQIMWEGETGAYMSRANADLQAMGTMAETMISRDAGITSANYALSAGMTGATQAYDANNFAISQNLTNGLFSSASSAVGSYYSGKAVSTSSMGSLMDNSNA